MKKLLEKIQNKIGEIRSWFRKIKVKRHLLRKYKYDYQLNLLLEQWIIKRILDGQVERRKELSEMQAKIKEMGLFINYFKNLK